MILLDTNIVSELMKPRPDDQVRDWLVSLGDERLATTAITVAEIEYGLHRLPDGKRRDHLSARFAQLSAAMNVLPLDTAAASQAGHFRAKRESLGLPTTASDMMIAGIAAVTDAALATRNTRDFTQLPLTLIDPWSGQ
jgi:predicted nucleic acid-binding protein